MPSPAITLTTDFGSGSPYVAAMKGTILSANPLAQLIDLTHDIRPQNVQEAAFFLAGCVPCFPRNLIHLVVVDPEVGSDRALLCIDLDGRLLVGPDTGFWCQLARAIGAEPRVYVVDVERLARKPCSATFHGRDIMAPAAAFLSLGNPPSALGSPATSWRKLDQRMAQIQSGMIKGEIVYADRFGNLITNINCEDLQNVNEPWVVEVAGQTVSTHVRTYAEVDPGTLVALISSFGLLELAVRDGSAELFLSCGVGTVVSVRERS